MLKMGVGRRLRQAREARGLSMAQVAASTKIPLRQLAALEAEEYDTLPGGIFARGHIRAAAKAVGLDPADLTEHYHEETGPSSGVSNAPAPEVAEDHGPRLRMAAEPDESRPKGQLVAALVILLSIVLALAWFGRERDVPPSSRNDGGGGPLMAALAATSDAPPRIGEPQAVGTIGTMPRGLVPDDGVPLHLRAQRVCWLALTVDGHRLAYRMLQEGETVTARMHQRAAVRTGDAGALLLSVGQGPARPLGASGAVRSIEFTPDDYGRLLGR
jgi:transcriptional regulator with XRE-family HTH domain